MSRPRLHELYSEFFDSKNNSDMNEILEHQDFDDFMNKHNLKIPKKEFIQSFTHTSFSHEFNISHQEQLEFLGDAVLQLIITDELFKRLPKEKEGLLSKLRAAIVNEKSLSKIAIGLGLGELLLVGKGEFKKKLFENPSVLADTFEALLAQVYRFHGMDFTRNLFLALLQEYLPLAFEESFLDEFDAKSRLQEEVLAKFKTLPRYSSEDVGSEFRVTLWINDEARASGVFSSKKRGEKELAQDVLTKKNF